MLNVVAVDEAYRHVPKASSSGPLLTAGSTRLKWYDVARADTPVPRAIHDGARRYLSETLRFDRDVGFVVLHRCGAGNDFYFLAACSWRNANELWESVYYRDAAMVDFAPFAQTGPHRGTFCVWELGPVIHEQREWVRFLKSRRTESDLDAYLASMFEGEVGF